MRKRYPTTREIAAANKEAERIGKAYDAGAEWDPDQEFMDLMNGYIRRHIGAVGPEHVPGLLRKLAEQWAAGEICPNQERRIR